MINADTLSFHEFAMSESLPLATIHAAVLEFLRGREDVVLFGAQAVNAYVGEPRMTQDIDLLSTRAQELAEELRQHLSQRFHIAVRLRQIADGKGLRLVQIRKSGTAIWLMSVLSIPCQYPKPLRRCKLPHQLR